MVMEEVTISEFKAKCLALIARVNKTKKPLRITKFGKPIAELGPPSAPSSREHWLGCMAGRGEILGDIISPATDPDEWEVLRD